MSTEEGRPDTVLEVWVRSWRALKVFFGGSGDFPGSVWGLIPFHIYVRTTFCDFFSEHSPDNRWQQHAESVLTPSWLQNYNMPSGSSSRQHQARVVGPRCSMATCFYRRLLSITRPHLCRCCLLCVIVSYSDTVNVIQTTDSNNSRRACLPPADYPWQPRYPGAAYRSLRSITWPPPLCCYGLLHVWSYN